MPAVQQMLNDVGFQVEIDYADFGNALALMRNNELPNPFIFNQAGVTSGAPLGSAFAYRLVTTIGAPYSHAQADDDLLPEFQEFQALIDQANVDFDQQRANDLYYQASVISYENAFQVPLFGLPHPLRDHARCAVQRVLRHLDRAQPNLRAEAQDVGRPTLPPWGSCPAGTEGARSARLVC